MSRSLKKGPYVDKKLLKRIEEMNEKNEKKVLKIVSCFHHLPADGWAYHYFHDGQDVPAYN